MKPRIVNTILERTGGVVETFSKEVIRRVISERTARQLTTILEGVISDGNGSKASVEGVRIAGKTGTAEIGGPESIPHSWFAAYAPAKSPEIALAVLVENAGEGSTVAAPLARQVVEAYYGLPLSPLPREAEEDYVPPTPTPAP